MSGANLLQFVDTNILIYAHDRSAGEKHEIAKGLVAGLWEERTGCVSIQVLQEFYVNVTQKVARPLARDAASQIISDLSQWHVHEPGVNDVLDAIRLQARHQLAFWDAMILASATALGCTTLWSEDITSGRRYDNLTVSSPFGPATRS
jgi:predicted nucleic acid-binding protein